MSEYQPLVDEDNNGQQPTGVVVSGSAKNTSNNVNINNDDTSVNATGISNAGIVHGNSEVSSLGLDPNFDDHRSDVSDDDWDEDDYDILNKIISRNYALLFFLTMFGAFIGFIIYVITDNSNYIWLCGCLGFCLAFTIDLLVPRKPFKIYYKDDLIVGEPKLSKWKPPQNGCKFYLQCDFTNYENRYIGSTAIYELDDNSSSRNVDDNKDNMDNNNNNNDDDDDEDDDDDLDVETKEIELDNDDTSGNNNGKTSEKMEKRKNDWLANQLRYDTGEFQLFHGNESSNTQSLHLFGGYDDSRILIFRQRHVYRLENYKGYEIGGGIAGMIGFIISCSIGGTQIAALDSYGNSDTAGLLSEIVTWILFIVFVTFVLFLLGCLCELELRKSDILPPISVTMEASEWIPVCEIIGWYYNSMGFDYNYEEEKPHNCCQKFALGWFKVIKGIIVFSAKVVKQLFVIILLNGAFGVWILITFAMGYSYSSYLKKDEKSLYTCLVFCVLAIFGNCICLWFVSNTSHGGCCGTNTTSQIGNNNVSKLANTRINLQTQNKFYQLLSISLILKILTFLTIVAIIVEIALSKGKSNDSLFEDFLTSNATKSHWKYITCQSSSSSSSSSSISSSITTNSTDSHGISDSKYNSSDIDTHDIYDYRSSLSFTKSSDKADLCTNYVYGESVGILVFLSIDWIILWIVAFWWYLVDNSMKFKRTSKPDTYQWRQYTSFTIQRKLNKTSHNSSSDKVHSFWKRHMPSFSSVINMGSHSQSTKEYTFRLDLETSLKLYYYLAKATSMYRKRKAIISNPWPTPMYNMPHCRHSLHKPHLVCLCSVCNRDGKKQEKEKESQAKAKAKKDD